MAAENVSVEHTSLPSQEIGLPAPERPLYTASAVELINAIEAHITVTPMYVPKEANSDRAGIPVLNGNLVPVAFYQGPAMNFCPDESYLPSFAHPEPHELAVEKEIHGYMRNIADLACKVAAAERMQQWWSRQKGLEARAQQLAEGVRATALFTKLQFAEANLAWAEHARDYRNRAPRSVVQALRVDLEELMDERKNDGKPVTTEKIVTLLEKYRQQGLRELYEDPDPSEMSGKTFSAPPSKAKAGGIPFSPPFTDASVSTSNLQTHSVANVAVRIAEITMLLAPAVAACQNAPKPISLTPIPQGATEMPVPTNPSPVTPEAPEVATPLPGGPDDEKVIANTLPWPLSISDITADLPAAGGPYNIVDVDAPNVRKQFDGVTSLLIRSGFTVTSVDNAINLVDKQVLLSPVENGKFGDKAQWAIAGITNKGFVIPVDKDGTIMDRPDWATSNVTEYVELTDGYGPEYQRFWEEYNGHWVPVVRDANGKLVAFYDINKGEFVRNIMIPESSATPAEIVIGCNDPVKAKEVFDEFKKNNDVDSLLNYKLDKTFSIGANWITVDFKALHVGTYKVSLEGKEVGGQIAGENSYATCVVLATPSLEEPLNVVSTVVVNGKRVWRSLVFNQVIDDPSVVADHIAREKGSLLDFQVLFAVDEPSWPIFKPFNYLKDKNDLNQIDASDIDLEALARAAKENKGLGLALFDVRNR